MYYLFLLINLLQHTWWGSTHFVWTPLKKCKELTYKLQHAVGVNEFRVGPLEKEESVDLLFRTESTSSFPLEALTNKLNNNSFLLLASPFYAYK